MRFIATILVPLQSLKEPLYNVPKSPSAITKLASKLLVAIFISASENWRHNPSGKAEDGDGFAPFLEVLNNLETPFIDASLNHKEIKGKINDKENVSFEYVWK